jgi:carbon-monoxide dehydrogenase small subunit
MEVWVNGEAADLGEPGGLLLDALRQRLELLSVHRGCESSYCGACTVLLDGAPVHSCTVLVGVAAGRRVETVEGLQEAPGRLHPLQEAFVAQGALQCGFCTSGFLMAARALLAESPDPSEADIRRHLIGNICRCTGYQQIVRAVRAAAPALAAPGAVPAASAAGGAPPPAAAGLAPRPASGGDRP